MDNFIKSKPSDDEVFYREVSKLSLRLDHFLLNYVCENTSGR